MLRPLNFSDRGKLRLSDTAPSKRLLGVNPCYYQLLVIIRWLLIIMGRDHKLPMNVQFGPYNSQNKPMKNVSW